MDVDELYAVRNNFYVGNFQVAIDEGESTPALSQQKQIELDVYVARSRLALGQGKELISSINQAPMAMEAVKALAVFEINPSKQDVCIEKVESWLGDEMTGNNPTLRLIAGLMYTKAGKYSEALAVLKGAGANQPEHSALMIHILILMNRIDAAQKELAELENSNADDAVITQLAQGWVYCSLGGGKTEEASYIFQELIDKFDPTVKLLNNLAVCKVHMEQYPEAEEMLTTALEENPGDVDSLVNLIVVSRHLNKSQEVIDNLMEQLKQKDPNNLKLKEWLEAEAIFDENVGNFK
jgi:tetratricopeptide (TPR) repeat protein